jgi:hypothetical protein
MTIVLQDACRTNPFAADAQVKKSPDKPVSRSARAG